MKMRTPRLLMAFLSASVLVSLGTASAQSPPQVIDKVEEDWRLVVATPRLVSVGPQITTCMSPVSNHSTAFVAFDLNYREYPTFAPGGMQIQIWLNQSLQSTASQGSTQMATANEVVTWTQQMSVTDGVVTYGINNGRSTTW